MRKRLAVEAAVVTQSSSPFFARRVFWCINTTMASIFDQTIPYNAALPSFGIWGFNLATVGIKVPDTWNISVPTKAIRPATLAKAMLFDKDIGPVKTPVNSLFRPKLHQFYTEDIRK